MDEFVGSDLKLDTLKKLVKKRDIILIGYPEGLPHSSGNQDLDYIAEVNSESKKHPRPFLKDGLENNKEKLKELIKQSFVSMIKGENPNHSKIGVEAVTSVQEFVKGNYYKSHSPNAESTIKRKTSKEGKRKGQYKDKPLIDTAQMINGLTFEVIKK